MGSQPRPQVLELAASKVAYRILLPWLCRPGLFEFIPADDARDDALEALETAEDDVVLLLRTSGTTSKPKGVPLRQGAIVRSDWPPLEPAWHPLICRLTDRLIPWPPSRCVRRPSAFWDD